MPGVVLTAAPSEKGYMRVALAGETYRVHRLVAAAFIPNPSDLPEVNHINGVKFDNRAANLEWVTARANALHKYQILGHVGGMAGKKGAACKNSKPVRGVPIAGGAPVVFAAASEAGRELEICASGISMAARGVLRSFKGYLWAYISKDEFDAAAA